MQMLSFLGCTARLAPFLEALGGGAAPHVPRPVYVYARPDHPEQARRYLLEVPLTETEYRTLLASTIPLSCCVGADASAVAGSSPGPAPATPPPRPVLLR